MSGKRLHWQQVDRQALAEHLRTRQIQESVAEPGFSLYHCQEEGGGQDSIALSLADGQCLLVTLGKPTTGLPERRKRPRPAAEGAGKGKSG